MKRPRFKRGFFVFFNQNNQDAFLILAIHKQHKQ